MLYDLTLRDLSIAATGTQIGVCLRLSGCQEVRNGAAMPDHNAFLTCMIIAKTIGYQMIAAGCLPTINAVEPPDDLIGATMADADGSELRADDVMYQVGNDYDSHQWMREAIRETLVKEGPRLQRARRASATGSRSRMSAEAQLQELHRNMCMLSLWLSLHDPEYANAMRQRMFECLKEYKRAVLSVACTENLAYARNISGGITDLSEALGYADNSDRSGLYSPRH